MLRCIVEKLNSTPAGRVRLFRMFGNTGVPAWVGERLMLIWLNSAGLTVLFAERSAFANARKGTRS